MRSKLLPSAGLAAGRCLRSLLARGTITPMKQKSKRAALLTATTGLALLVMTGVRFHHEIIAWVKFVRAFEDFGTSAQGFREYRHRQTGIVMLRLPGGTFWMGAQKTNLNGPNYDPNANEAEGPVHEVKMSSFLIAKYEVTQAQWQAVMESNPSHFKGDTSRPVERISWSDIQPFLKKTGLALPAEEQWEYACRAGTTTPYAGTLDDLGWSSHNSSWTTHPVGQKEPNAFGLYDLHGNLYEWCAPTVCDESRTVRGGPWDLNPVHCRSACRAMYDVGTRSADIGFRVVWPAQ